MANDILMNEVHLDALTTGTMPAGMCVCLCVCVCVDLLERESVPVITAQLGNKCCAIDWFCNGGQSDQCMVCVCVCVW